MDVNKNPIESLHTALSHVVYWLKHSHDFNILRASEKKKKKKMNKKHSIGRRTRIEERITLWEFKIDLQKEKRKEKKWREKRDMNKLFLQSDKP